jgi:hypothetical protein
MRRVCILSVTATQMVLIRIALRIAQNKISLKLQEANCSRLSNQVILLEQLKIKSYRYSVKNLQNRK